MDIYGILWNGALTVGVAIMVFMMNRVATTLDTLQRTDKEMSKEVADMKANTMTRSEVDKLLERMEKRLDGYHSMHVETSKVIFAKLDMISDRIGSKIDRSECLSRSVDMYSRKDD
jgi:hypothetical protein